MQQFNLYHNKEQHSAYPLLVDIQHDLLQALSTRLVIPLTSAQLFEGQVPATMCPILHLIQGEFVLLPQYMSSIPCSALGEQAGSLSNFREEIIAAVDLLLTGV